MISGSNPEQPPLLYWILTRIFLVGFFGYSLKSEICRVLSFRCGEKRTAF